MFTIPGIVLVDNEEKELAQLTEAFQSAGLPCLPIHYLNDSTNKTGVDHVSIADNLKTRILITDLNLREGQKLDAKDLVSPIAKVIERLVSAGPYILVFWSKHKDAPEEVVKLLEERFKDSITLPIEWARLDKNDFLVKDDDDETINENLKQKIINVVRESKIFNALLDWESRVSEAARITTSTLYELTKPVDFDDGNYIQQHQENLKKVLTAIASESVGLKNVTDLPSVAMDTGLMPVLSDQLSSITENVEGNKIWVAALPGLGEKVKLDDGIKAELNSFYHVEEIDNNHPRNSRGVFVEISSDCIKPGEKRNKLEKHIGQNIDDILNEEFLCVGGKPESQRDPARQETTLGFIELSAECDHAQKKIKLHRYILGALIPYKYYTQTIFKGARDVERKTSHQGIYRLPMVILKGEKYIIKFSFKYQFGSHAENQWFGSPLFRVREQILSEISFLSSQYSSRPGITGFY